MTGEPRATFIRDVLNQVREPTSCHVMPRHALNWVREPSCLHVSHVHAFSVQARTVLKVLKYSECLPDYNQDNRLRALA